MDDLHELIDAMHYELADTGTVSAASCLAAARVMYRRMKTAEERSEDLQLGLMQVKSLLTIRADTSAADIRKLHVNVRAFIYDLLEPGTEAETKPMEVYRAP